jgi:hypothetical protein
VPDSADAADADADTPSVESVRRQLLIAMAALVAFLLCAGVAVAVSRSDDSGDPGVGSPEDALIGTGTGPLAGTELATYTAGRERALADAKGRWAAVVSLRNYATQDDFAKAFESLGPEATLVATEGGEPEVVTGDLKEWAAKVRADAEEERKQLQSMVATTEDKAFKDQFNADIDRLGKLLANLDPAKPVVFGFVVTASAGELRQLAGRAEVRLIDIVGRRPPSSLVHLRGVRPDETVKAGEPRTRPV